MNFISLRQSTLFELGWVLVHSVWIGGLVAVLAALTSRSMERASAHAKYCVLLAALFSIPVLSIAFQFVQFNEPVIDVTSTRPLESTRESGVDSLAEEVVLEPVNSNFESNSVSTASVGEELKIESPHKWDAYLPAVSLAWLVGVFVMALRLVVGWCMLQRRLLSCSCAVSELTQQAVNSARRKMKLHRSVAIRESVAALVPMTFNVLRPIVLLPVGIATNLSAQELEAILLHELAHIRRHDYLFNWLQVVVETLMFYHPAVWWLSHRIRCERENACDDVVMQLIESRNVYARALTKVAANSKCEQMTLNLAADGGLFSQRIRRIIGLPAERASFGTPPLGVGGLLTIAAVVAVLMSTWSDTPAEQAAGPSANATFPIADDGSIENPADEISLSLETAPPKLIQLVDEDGKPIAASVVLRIYYRSNSWMERKFIVDSPGRINVTDFIATERAVFAVQVIARNASLKRVAFFRTEDIESLSDTPTEVTLQPEASLVGRIVDAETQEPIPEATIRLNVNYTSTTGQGVANFTTDKEGRFQFEQLVTGMTYSIGADANNYTESNSINTKFQAESGEQHEIEMELEPKIPASTMTLAPVSVPQTKELSADARFEFLVKAFDAANKAYRAAVDDTKSPAAVRRIVELREPTPAYSDAIAELAEANRDSELELKALLWLVQRSEVVGSSRSIRPDRTQAATRLMAAYAARPEIADEVSGVIHASPDPYATAMELMKSPHREVRGRAFLTGAELVVNKLQDQYRGDSELLRERAVELFQTVIDDYADIEHWRHETIGKHAAIQLFRLERIQIGEQAPEVEGSDLDGRPMKLSDFQGQVVVIHHWHSGINYFYGIKEIADRFQSSDVVILGVNTDDDAKAAIAELDKTGVTLRSWHDPDEKLHSKWSSSIPRSFVVDRDGTFVYTGQNVSNQPLLDVVADAVEKVESR